MSKSSTRLRRVTPKQAYAFSRLVQKRSSKGDGASEVFFDNLRNNKLKQLAREVIRVRDDPQQEVSLGARAIASEVNGDG